MLQDSTFRPLDTSSIPRSDATRDNDQFATSSILTIEPIATEHEERECSKHREMMRRFRQDTIFTTITSVLENHLPTTSNPGFIPPLDSKSCLTEVRDEADQSRWNTRAGLARSVSSQSRGGRSDSAVDVRGYDGVKVHDFGFQSSRISPSTLPTFSIGPPLSTVIPSVVLPGSSNPHGVDSSISQVGHSGWTDHLLDSTYKGFTPWSPPIVTDYRQYLNSHRRSGSTKRSKDSAESVRTVISGGGRGGEDRSGSESDSGSDHGCGSGSEYGTESDDGSENSDSSITTVIHRHTSQLESYKHRYLIYCYTGFTQSRESGKLD